MIETTNIQTIKKEKTDIFFRLPVSIVNTLQGVLINQEGYYLVSYPAITPGEMESISKLVGYSMNNYKKTEAFATMNNAEILPIEISQMTLKDISKFIERK